MDPLRGDRLFLALASHARSLTQQQAAAQRRLMEAFSDVAAGGRRPLSFTSQKFVP